MTISRKKLAGTCIFLGAALFLLGVVVAELLYPHYSQTKAISDLGVGTTALIFNASIVIFGILVIAGVQILSREGGNRYFSGLLALTGTGALCTGMFPETTGTPHIIAAVTVFLFGGISAMYSMKVFRPPWGWISLILGSVSLAALILLAVKIFLGLGFGGMERMAAYPLILWALGTGGYLMADRHGEQETGDPGML
ncbi:DUF998 domain-containing protein [uncultured Methanoregula sp.]|uniref:DUF998 domain-containing protein n=1 Tax=uncultured Methanoregula sp. TaxID=1005933 RepID=UPI002AAB38BB|nr:DUF998 domain-containing protein [uncultured Methanoregula sp.]